MTQLTTEQLQTLRDALEAERVTLQTDLAEHGEKEPNGEWEPTSSGLVGEEADSSDAADQIEELVTNVPIVHDLAERAHDVEEALTKIAEGTYGFCEVDGEEISYERLIANPAARTCLEHAE